VNRCEPTDVRHEDRPECETAVPTRLLVSVRNGDEALAALNGGADIIDVKEPYAGPLGMPTRGQIEEVVRRVAGERPVSVALGDLPTSAPVLPDQIRFAKVGFAHCGNVTNGVWRSQLESTWGNLPPSCQRVIAIYADWRAANSPAPADLLAAAHDMGCQGLLVDTYQKGLGSLLDLCSPTELSEWIATARRLRWFVALAGSLDTSSLPGAIRWKPDIVGVRGAACPAGRNSTVSTRRVTDLKHYIWHLQCRDSVFAQRP